MKTYLSFTVAALFATIATSDAAPDKDALMEKEKSAWQSFKDKKPDEFKKVVDSNVVALYASGVLNLQGELSDMQKVDLKSFNISDYAATSIDANTVISTYKVTTEATREGKDISGTFYGASVWKKEGTDWKVIFHTDTGGNNSDKQ